jgi:ribosome-binding ATPase YchF (GTP1/OBG family)
MLTCFSHADCAGGKEFEDPINDIDALESRLLQWHLANLEYACAVNVKEVYN